MPKSREAVTSELPDGAICEHDKYVSTGRWGDWQSCGNKAKGRTANGKLACGVHIGAEKRRDRKRAEEAAQREASANKGAAAAKRIEALEGFEIKSVKGYSSVTHQYTGGVNLSADDTDKLIELLGDLRRG